MHSSKTLIKINFSPKYFSVGKNCASCGTEREHRNQKGGTTEVLPPECRRRQKLCRPVAPNGNLISDPVFLRQGFHICIIQF